MSNVLALTVEGSLSNHHTQVDVVAVIGDGRGRLLFTHPGYPDLWSLPAALLEPGRTPHESLRKSGAIDDSETGEVMGVWSLAHQSDPGAEPNSGNKLMVAYRFRRADSESSSGSFFPVGLVPLNTEPSHLAVAASAVRKIALADRLELPSGTDHLTALRSKQIRPEFRSQTVRPLVDEVAGSQSLLAKEAGTREKLREAEVLIAAGQQILGGEVLRSILASGQADPGSILKAELRLEEIESEHGAFPLAWSRLSASSGNGGLFLDLILAQLGYAALRRHRFREGEAYLRRALAVCEVPPRRAAIRYSLTWRPSGFPITV